MVYVVPRVCSEGVADVGRAVRSITDIDMCCIEIVYFFPERKDDSRFTIILDERIKRTGYKTPNQPDQTQRTTALR